MRPVFKWIHDNHRDLFNLFNFYWTYEICKPDFGKPCIWFEHGIPDDNICNQLYKKSYYFCASLNTYNYLIERGYKAYYTGSIITDDIYIDKRIKSKNYLVYIPYHPTNEKYPIINTKELNKISLDNKCNGYISSSIDDMNKLNEEYNPLHSDRYDYINHFEKCTYLLSNAKVVLADLKSTFSIIAENYGIKVIYRDFDGVKYDKLKMFNNETICIHKDRLSKERTLRALNDIRRIERI